MMRIAICDDDFQLTEFMERLIGDIQNTLEKEIQVSTYYSGESFSTAIEGCCLYDIVLMDIEMSGMNGITAGQKLRANDENDLVQLIYISSHEEYHLQLFDVQPSGFIQKPINPEFFRQKLLSGIQKVMRKQEQGKNRFLPVYQKGQELLIPFRDILYLESSIRRVCIYTTKEDTIKYYGVLNEEEKKLPTSGFIRIHQSYIVNFSSIKQFSNRKIVLINDQELPISEKRSSAVKKGYLNFRGDFIG
ncbi:LytTR family DNA-binding domain-containing protein [Paenibacillus sp. FSL H8-0122]|uniref:LytR/AlgR family response regulator transcription factor n=1 Tax=Paenibacillus sp. FSL H8-0122 TaxID=2954510 RepID=UPI0030FB78C4